MQLVELSGRVRQVDNRGALNNPRMVGSLRVSSPLMRDVFLSYGTENSWEEEGCKPHGSAPSKVTACLEAPSGADFATGARGHAWAC